MKTISKAEYARHRGVTPAAICNAIRRGKITPAPDGKINPVTADAEWEYNRQRQPAIKTTPAIETVLPVSATPGPRIPATPSNPTPLDEDERYLDHHAVWICLRFMPGADLADLLDRWLSPIPDRATLLVELEKLLRVFSTNIDLITNPENEIDNPDDEPDAALA